jgi:urease accessory protein
MTSHCPHAIESPGRKRSSAKLLALLALIASPAFAHPGVDEAASLAHGLLHPLGGSDHVLAMVGVGLLAWMLRGRALWALPATFVGVMSLAAAVTAMRLPTALVELGIALSVLGIGLLLARGKQVPLALTLMLVAVFAGFHGQAHADAMPADASGLAYGLGFAATTAMLHLSGVLAGFGLARLADLRARVLVRASGLAMSSVGALWVAASIAS